MAKIINKIDFTCDEMNAITEALKVFEQLYEKADRCDLVNLNGIFVMEDYDIPKEMEDLYDLFNYKFSV